MRILRVESDAERTRCRMTQGSSVIATKLIPGRGNEIERDFTIPFSSTM